MLGFLYILVLARLFPPCEEAISSLGVDYLVIARRYDEAIFRLV